MTLKYIFVHIPKTAGTSFRISAKEQMACLWDYGPDSRITSELIKKVMYEKQNINLAQVSQERGFEMISGHFHDAKYTNIYPQARLVTFVREPIARVISEYNNLVRRGEYTQDIKSFCSQPSESNKQFRLLAQVGIKGFYFIGITEYYAQSLQIFNQMAGLALEELQMNFASSQKRNDLEISLENLDSELIGYIKGHNQKDIELYESVKKLPYLNSIW